MSEPFKYKSGLTRPVGAVVIMLFMATGVAFAALKCAIAIEQAQRRAILLISCFALSLRALGILTTPIMEIDYYRYLWDGKVLATGVSPYRYSPSDVLEKRVIEDRQYEDLVALSTRSASNHTILSRIHFSEYTTIYPPVSQIVFGVSMSCIPSGWSVKAHVVWMRCTLVVFDLLTIALLIRLLSILNIHVGWLIAYAWNPLVIKEIANSGHLDSIAVFFMLAAIYCVAVWSVNRDSNEFCNAPFWSGLTLGLGIGAKLFPVVLAPMICVLFARSRFRAAVQFSLVLVVTSGCVLWPMFHEIRKRESVLSSDYRSKKEGLSGFLSSWTMNDVVFSCVYRNLKPDQRSGSFVPWYVVTSNDFRSSITQWCSSRSVGGANPAYLLARVITMSIFAVFYLWQLQSVYRGGSQLELERFAWILAVFLFLQPTVNPWYWVWVAPLTCLAANRGWLWVSGFLLIYYLRFWLEPLQASYSIGGQSYSGASLFHHGVVWIEFTAIISVLVLFRSYRLRTSNL